MPDKYPDPEITVHWEGRDKPGDESGQRGDDESAIRTSFPGLSHHSDPHQPSTLSCPLTLEDRIESATAEGRETADYLKSLSLQLRSLASPKGPSSVVSSEPSHTAQQCNEDLDSRYLQRLSDDLKRIARTTETSATISSLATAMGPQSLDPETSVTSDSCSDADDCSSQCLDNYTALRISTAQQLEEIKADMDRISKGIIGDKSSHPKPSPLEPTVDELVETSRALTDIPKSSPDILSAAQPTVQPMMRRVTGQIRGPRPKSGIKPRPKQQVSLIIKPDITLPSQEELKRNFEAFVERKDTQNSKKKILVEKKKRLKKEAAARVLKNKKENELKAMNKQAEMDKKTIETKLALMRRREKLARQLRVQEEIDRHASIERRSNAHHERIKKYNEENKIKARDALAKRERERQKMEKKCEQGKIAFEEWKKSLKTRKGESFS
eukprot:UC4_evm3s488